VPLKKNRWLAFLVVFFLIQYFAPSETFSEPNILLPQLKTVADPSDPMFKEIYQSVYTGLSIYMLDVTGCCTKEKLMAGLESAPGGPVKFDIENMDLGKKGCTRYYPFSIEDKNFIMRICLTEELRYQPKVKVLYEGTLVSPPVTFQVLPSVNDILSDCKIAPFKIYSSSQVDRSP